jgi:hypothetical protein
MSKPFRFGPQALSNAAANILNPGTTTGGVLNGSNFQSSVVYVNLRIIVRHIRIVNKTAGAVTFSLYIGATGGSAAGTEFMGTAVSVPANSYVDWYGAVPLFIADFLTGLASAATSLTIEGEGDLDVA